MPFLLMLNNAGFMTHRNHTSYKRQTRQDLDIYEMLSQFSKSNRLQFALLSSLHSVAQRIFSSRCDFNQWIRCVCVSVIFTVNILRGEWFGLVPFTFHNWIQNASVWFQVDRILEQVCVRKVDYVCKGQSGFLTHSPGAMAKQWAAFQKWWDSP